MNTKLIQKFLIIIALFCVTPCLSQKTIPKGKQKKCEKIIKKAIENGKNSEGLYTTRLVGKFMIPYVPLYLRQNGYACISVSESEKYKGFKTFEFINKNELADYMCSKYLPSAYKSYTKDCHWHYYPFEFRKPNYRNGKDLTQMNLNRKGDLGVVASDKTVTTFPICWSGKTTGRSIDGEGIGYHIDGDSLYIYENGLFACGFPIYKAGSDIYRDRLRIRKIIWNGEQIQDLGTLKVTHIDYSEIRNLMRHKDDGPTNANDRPVSEDALTQEDAKAYFAREEYKGWYDIIENRYHELENIAKRIDNSIYDINSIIKGGENTTYIINLLEKSGYDPQQIRPKALEILNIIKVLKARNFLFWKRTEPLEESVIKDALECARKGSIISTDINDFYKNSIRKLENNITDYEVLVKNYWESKIREERQERAERNLSESGEIDWSRSYEPSGKLESFGLLTISGYKHEKDGQIYTKRGHNFFYNIIYDSSKNFDNYIVNTTYGRMKTYYKSKDEMIRDFLDYARNNP